MPDLNETTYEPLTRDAGEMKDVGIDVGAVDIPADRHDLRILRSLRRIIRAVELYSHQLDARHGITAPQLACLMKLVEEGPVILRTLAEKVFLSSSTVVGIVDRLQSKGLVTRTRSTRDRRQVLIEATDAGRRLAEKTPLPMHEALARALQNLPVEDRAALSDTLEQIIDLMDLDQVSAAPILQAGAAVEADEEGVAP